jgi:hypothetical protein
MSPVSQATSAAKATEAPAAAFLHGVTASGQLTRQLAEIAFIGAFCGQEQAAETIFRSLRVLCPGNAHVELGLAMVCSIAGRPMDGLSLLEKLPLSPQRGRDSPAALIPLCAGLMLREEGHRAAADRKLAEAVAQGGSVADLARALSGPVRD